MNGAEQMDALEAQLKTLEREYYWAVQCRTVVTSDTQAWADAQARIIELRGRLRVTARALDAARCTP